MGLHQTQKLLCSKRVKSSLWNGRKCLPDIHLLALFNTDQISQICLMAIVGEIPVDLCRSREGSWKIWEMTP
jgi:hypothetical protein